LYYSGQYDLAIQQFQRTLRRDPTFFPAHAMLGRAYQQKEMFAQSVDELRLALGLAPRSPMVIAELAHALARSGQREEAVRLLDDLNARSREQFVPSYSLALVYSGLRQKEVALRLLDKAYEERSTDIIHLATDPRFEEFRSDDRFREMVRRIGLQP
jgi:tetratricopeptide (TPR) repeat protein